MTRRHQHVGLLLDLLYDGIDRSRIDDVLEDIDQALAAVAGDWPSWARSLVDLLEAADGTSHGGGAGVSDPTAGAVARRAPLTSARARVFGHLDDALYALKQARTEMASVTRTAGADQLQADLRDMRCSGGGTLPGALVWGDASCGKLAVRRGLCWGHYHKLIDWERAQNLDQAAGRARR